jgi:hypothetical protein
MTDTITTQNICLSSLVTLCNIDVQILPVADSAGLKTWYDVSSTSEKDPSLILELLMEAKEVRNKY